MAERTLDTGRGRLGFLGLALDFLDLGLVARALGIERGDAVKERLAPADQNGIALGDLVQARAELRRKLLATVLNILDLHLELCDLYRTTGGIDLTLHRILDIVDKPHGGSFLVCGQ